MANAPVQVILNADGYRKKREVSRPVGNGTDFFKGASGAFADHKEKLLNQIELIEDEIDNNSWRKAYGEITFIKVKMRNDALAKSHRPIKAVFREDKAPEVGADGLGEMICALDTEAFHWVSSAIGQAEIDVRKKINSKTGMEEDAPSRYRCEVGAIEKIEIWNASDRRNFEIPFAVDWLSDPRSGHVYYIELFESVSYKEKTHANKILAGLLTAQEELPNGTIVIVPKNREIQNNILEIKLTTLKKKAQINFRKQISEDDLSAKYNSDIEAHKKLIKVFETHPLVKRIHLPNHLEKSPSASTHTSRIYSPPAPAAGITYPKLGVIDGGISKLFDPWILSRTGTIHHTHKQEDHGTFISGLVINGKHLNPKLDVDPDGCLLVDIDIFPSTNFTDYYPSGMSDFFDEIEEAVRSAVEDHGIRIFNLSLNAVSPALLQSYSLEAQRLDQISDTYDVIFVISAGNTGLANMRPEWPKNHTLAAAILASHRDDQLFVPAESIRNISVAALNPSHHSACISEMPARYSRRGPGLRTGVKPDISHIGGSGTICPTAGHGLNSILPTGQVITGCGTSYAAPLAAKMIASLDANIDGDVTRETLTALSIHNSTIDSTLKRKEFNGVAQQLVGFGKPSTALNAINHGDHEITMLFSSRMTSGKALEFKFSWPTSLVTPDGKCQGDVKLTLVSSPPLDHAYGAEFVRVNIEAALQQEQEDGKFKSGLEPTYVFFTKDERTTEADLIEHKFKWSPIKAYRTSMPKGRGKTSNWRLMVNYLTRAGENLPDEGVPFTILITISDPTQTKPIFQEMRSSLQTAGAKLADIQTATRVNTRV